MNRRTKRVLYWTPRVICILSAAFISIFALDVFDEGRDLWGTLLALLIHLIPTYVVIIALVVAWHWEIVGAIAFNALGLAYIIWAWGRFHWSAYVVIAGPLFIVGILFLLNWIYRPELRSR
jgi:hypothetical protein